MSDTANTTTKRKYRMSAEGLEKIRQAGRTKNPKKGFGTHRDLAKKYGKQAKQTQTQV